MIIEVTKEDIDVANRMRASGKFWPSNGYCPIARAIKRTHSISYAWVSLDLISFNGKRYWLPPEAETFISTWDDFCEVKPFSFEAKEVELSYS